MTARVPERLQVGPFAFTVTTDASAVARMRHEANDGRYAQTDLSHLQITVDAELPAGQVRDSMLHETLHAVIATAGGWPKELSEEDAVRRFAPLLLDTLRRNPHLVAFLTSEPEA